jgi:hypothetical protein
LARRATNAGREEQRERKKERRALGCVKTHIHTAVWRRSYLSLLLLESRLFSATASTITTEKKPGETTNRKEEEGEERIHLITGIANK